MNIEKLVLLSQKHQGLSPDKIALSAYIGDTPEERRAIATQVSLSKKLEGKLPTWHQAGVYIPHQVNLEQASSEVAALSKARFVRKEDILIDLSGGLGVDFWAMSKVAKKGIYTERQTELFEASKYNLHKLQSTSNQVMLNVDSTEHLEYLLESYQPTLIYVDPARREDTLGDKRVYALEDCSPSLRDLIDTVKQKVTHQEEVRIVAKVSPMLDIKHTLQSIPETSILHCVSIRNEVKEIILEIQPSKQLDKPDIDIERVAIKAYNIDALGKEASLEGSIYEDRVSHTAIATKVGRFIYEPYASLMKTGLYNLIAEVTATSKLHPNSHLYTSDELRDSFPGRKLQVVEIIPYESKVIKQLNKRILRAQITCRNFPTSADNLRKKLRIADNSEATIVATTLYDGSLVLIYCKGIN